MANLEQITSQVKKMKPDRKKTDVQNFYPFLKFHGFMPEKLALFQNGFQGAGPVT